MAGLDVGSVFVRVGALFEDKDFAKWDREVAQARVEAEKPIKVDAGVDVDKRGFAAFRREIRDSNSELGKLTQKMRDANTGTTFFSRALSMIKWPALIAGAGMAVTALSALAGGAVALGGALGNLSGLMAAYPALASAMVQATGTAKLAFAGIGEAAGGLNEKLDKTSKEFKALTPEAKRFVVALQPMKKDIVEMQRTAQRGLFPGAEKGLTSLMKNLPEVQTIVGKTSKLLGDLAERAGRQFGSDGWGRDLERQGERNLKTINRLGGAGLHLTDTLRHVTLAGGPLVDFLTKGAKGFAQNTEEAAKAGRESGRLQRFFKGTADTMRVVSSMGGHLAKALFEIGKAGAPLGRTILKDLDSAAGRFERWTKSASGKNQIADYFKGIKAPLYAVAGLIGDVTKAFFRLGSSEAGRSGFLKMVHAIRKDLLPVLEDVIASTTAAFGPALIELITNVLRVLGSLAGTSGPLTMFVRLLAKAAGALADLLDSNPALQSMVVSIAGLAAVVKTVSFLAWISGLKTVVGLWKQVKTAATGAAVAQGAAGAAGGVGGAGAAAGVGVTKGMQAGVAGGAAGVIATLRGRLFNLAKKGGMLGVGLVAANELMGEMGRQINVRSKDLFKRLEGKGKTPGLKATSVLGPYLGAPIDDLFETKQVKQSRDLLGALKRIRDERAQISKARARELEQEAKAIGLTKEQLKGVRQLLRVGQSNVMNKTKMEENFARLRKGTDVTWDAIAKTTTQNMRLIRRSMDVNSEGGREAVTKNFRLGFRAIKRSMNDGNMTTKEGMRAIQRLMRVHSGAGKDALAQNMGLVRRNLWNTMAAGKKITDEGMGAIRKVFAAELRAYGLTEEAVKFRLAGKEQSGKSIGGIEGGNLTNKAKGGRLKRAAGGFLGAPGDVGPDSIATSAPEGSSVINRHQMPWLDAALAAQGGLVGLLKRGTRAAGGRMVDFIGAPGEIVLGPDQTAAAHAAMLGGGMPGGLDGLFSAVSTPHHMAKGGRAGGGRGMAKGGIVELLWRVKDHYNHLHVAMSSGIVALGRRLQKMGFNVAEHPAFGGVGGHSADSYHYRGMAIDVNADTMAGGEMKNLDRLYAMLKSGKIGSMALGAFGGLGRAVKKIPRQVVSGPDGAFKQVMQGSLDKARGAAQKRLRELAPDPVIGGKGALGRGVGPAGPGVATRAEMVRWARIALHRTGHGASPTAINKILELARKESGWEKRSMNLWDSNAAAGNPSGGLMHVTRDKMNGASLFDPVLNMIASIRYQFSRYGGLITHSPYALGGWLRGFAPGGRLRGGTGVRRGKPTGGGFRSPNSPLKGGPGRVKRMGQSSRPWTARPSRGARQTRGSGAGARLYLDLFRKQGGFGEDFRIPATDALLGKLQGKYDDEAADFDAFIGEEEFVLPPEVDPTTGAMVKPARANTEYIAKLEAHLTKMMGYREKMNLAIEGAQKAIKDYMAKLRQWQGMLRAGRNRSNAGSYNARFIFSR